MSERDDTLASLRKVFRDEVDDHLASLEAASLTLAGDDEAARRDAASEVFRAVHSLKGASRAVEFPTLERFFHLVEARLGSARRGEEADLPHVASLTEVVLDALRANALSLASKGAPDESALQHARIALQTMEARAERPSGLPVTPPAPPPAPVPAPPVVREPQVSAMTMALKPENAAVPDTLRVSSARLGELFVVAEDLASLVARQGESARQYEFIEQRLSEVRSDVRRARQRLHAHDGAHDEEAAHALDRGLAALQTLTTWVADRRARDELSWRGVSGAAADLLARSRDLRVVPVAALAPLLERATREAASTLGKQVEFVMEGERTEVDRRVLDGLREPLLHLVRNAVDHGIESSEVRAAQGKSPVAEVRVVATLAGRDVRVAVVDDGRGIDPAAVLAAARSRGMDTSGVRAPHDALALLFEPGFSTRETVTALSGRGVGLDVVRTRVAQMHGRVDVEGTVGRGARFVLTVPMDLSVMRGLVVRVRDTRAVLVATAVAGLRLAPPEDLRSIEGHLYLAEPDGLIPLADLGATLGLPEAMSTRGSDARTPCVILAVGERRVAFRVDALLEEREVVVRPLNARVRRAAFVSGAAVFGDGEVVLVLDAADLTRIARPTATANEVAEARAPRRRVLVVDDSVTTRQLERTILEAAGFEVAVAPDGQAAWDMLNAEARFDAVVSDIEMPRLDGFQLLARARATTRFARLPIVLVTALSSETDQQRAIDLGASAYVVKSRFDQEELIETLQQLL